MQGMRSIKRHENHRYSKQKKNIFWATHLDEFCHCHYLSAQTCNLFFYLARKKQIWRCLRVWEIELSNTYTVQFMQEIGRIMMDGNSHHWSFALLILWRYRYILYITLTQKITSETHFCTRLRMDLRWRCKQDISEILQPWLCKMWRHVDFGPVLSLSSQGNWNSDLFWMKSFLHFVKPSAYLPRSVCVWKKGCQHKSGWQVGFIGSSLCF